MGLNVLQLMYENIHSHTLTFINVMEAVIILISDHKPESGDILRITLTASQNLITG